MTVDEALAFHDRWDFGCDDELAGESLKTLAAEVRMLRAASSSQCINRMYGMVHPPADKLCDVCGAGPCTVKIGGLTDAAL